MGVGALDLFFHLSMNSWVNSELSQRHGILWIAKTTTAITNRGTSDGQLQLSKQEIDAQGRSYKWADLFQD
jgi:hypothetical protein